MNRLLTVCLLICCLLPLIASPLPTAAARDDSKTIYLYVDINEGDWGNQDGDFPPGSSNFSLALFATVRDLLISEGFAPVFVAASTSENYPDFFAPLSDYEDVPGFWKKVLMVSPVSYGEADWVYLTLFAGYQFSGLPMGSFGLTLIPRLSTERIASLDEVARLTAGLALYSGHYCAEALPYLTEASTNDALLADGIVMFGAMFYRANCEYDQGLLADAAASYQAVIDFPFAEVGGYDIHQFSDNTAINLAWIDAQQGKLDEGIALLDSYGSFSFLSYARQDMERFLKRADVYLALGADDAAMAEVTKIITLAEQDSTEFRSDELAFLYTARGERYLRLGQVAAAQSDFNHAIQINTQYPEAYYWLGTLYSKNHQSTRARADFVQFLALTADYAPYYYEDDLTPYIAQANTYLAQK